MFLTALHCFSDPASEAASVVVYWNYQRSDCGSGTATLSGSQSGAVVRYLRPPTDMLLLELDDRLDPEHDLYLAGWDSRLQTPASTVSIHHPRSHFSRSTSRTNL